MTAHTVYQFDIPDAPIAAGFTDGEKALTVNASIDAVPPRTAWYLSRYIVLEGGNYTLKINGSDPFVWSIGPGLNTTKRVISAGTSSGFPYQADFYVRGGQQRIDMQLFNVSMSEFPVDPDLLGPVEPFLPQPSNCYAAFSLWKDGRLVYASTADGWLFDSAWVPDAAFTDLEDERIVMPVWAIPPNWKGGVLETLIFDTEILTSETDDEQRRSLARNPRRTVEAQFLRDGINAQRMNEFMTGVGTRKFLVPFWPEQWRIEHALAIGATTITIDDARDFDKREFYPGGMLILTKDGDPTIYEAFTYSITYNIDGTMSLNFDQSAGGVKKAWPKGTRITPLYVAHFDGVPALQYVTGTVVTAGVRFNYVDTVRTITPSWDYCAPLWRFLIDWSQPWAESFNRLPSTLDTGIAPIDVFDYGGITKIGQTLAITLKGRDAVVNYRSFITMARGKTVRFWMPSHHNDLTPVSDVIAGTTLSAKSSGYTQWLIDPQDAKLMIGINFKSGAPTVYRRVTFVAPGLNTDVFSLDEPLPTIQMKTVSRIFFVMPARFDQDSFELSHIVDDLGVVTAAPVIRSAEILNMPPIDCWVTSQPYPVIAMDGLSSTSRLTSGSFSYEFDGLSVSSVISSGSFPESFTFGSYDAGAEGLTSSSLLTGGAFTEYTSGSYTMVPDGFSSSSRISSGSFPQHLIAYTIPSESLSSTSRITSGTFS